MKYSVHITILIILMIVIIASGGVIIYTYTINEINSCTSNPLVYASNKFIKDYGNELYGYGNFKDVNDYMFNLEFNATSLIIKDPNSQEISDNYYP